MKSLGYNSGVYQPEKVGALLSCLGDHRVYRYDTNWVIKFSQFDRCRTTPDLEQFYRTEVTALTEIFGEYYLQPTVVTDPERTRVAVIQPFVVGEPLRNTHFTRADIFRQFQDIEYCWRKSQQAGEYIDLVGGGRHFFLAAFGNIFVTSDGKLLIIDSSILRPKDFSVFVRFGVWFVIFCGNHIQKQRIKKVLSLR